jgi:hypothetical protein
VAHGVGASTAMTELEIGMVVIGFLFLQVLMLSGRMLAWW